MLIVLLGPPIAIFCRHDTRYFFAFSLSSTAVIHQPLWWRPGPDRCPVIGKSNTN